MTIEGPHHSCPKCGMPVSEIWWHLHQYLHFLTTDIKHTGRFL